MTLCMWALANIGEMLPGRGARGASRRGYPLHPKLAFAHAMLLVALDRSGCGGQALRRAIYLDRSLAAAHVALGQILHRLGDVAGASRALRIGYDLAAAGRRTRYAADGRRNRRRMAAAAKAHLALNAEATMDRPQ